MPNSGGTDRPKAVPSILSSARSEGDMWLLPASPLSWFSNHSELWRRKRNSADFWPSRKLLCFAFSLKIVSELLCRSYPQITYKVPRLHPHDENQPPYNAVLPPDANEFSSPFSSLPLPLRTGIQPVLTGQPSHQGYWLSFSPGSPTR